MLGVIGCTFQCGVRVGGTEGESPPKMKMPRLARESCLPCLLKLKKVRDEVVGDHP